MFKKREIVWYTGKSGVEKKYKIVAKSKDGKRVQLESFGKNPIHFWVDAEKTSEVEDDEW
jgi:hypothetical protein